MCIFLALPTSTGYILWSNRDEQVTRATADEVSRDVERKCQYVKDLVSWGTWLAVHESWVYAVLLNAPSGNPGGVFATRGMMALQVMERCALWDDLPILATKIQQELPRKTYRSCIFAIGGIHAGKLQHHVFMRQTQTQHLDHQTPTWSLFLSSPNLYTADGHNKRDQESKRIAPTTEALKAFMSSHTYDVGNSLCIIEEDVGTRSTSIITVGEQVSYTYEIRA